MLARRRHPPFVVILKTTEWASNWYVDHPPSNHQTYQIAALQPQSARDGGYGGGCGGFEVFAFLAFLLALLDLILDLNNMNAGGGGGGGAGGGGRRSLAKRDIQDAAVGGPQLCKRMARQLARLGACALRRGGPSRRHIRQLHILQRFQLRTLSPSITTVSCPSVE
ncbi:uncharacterized protein LOC135197730 [Macrobrachium nipponense]|uniref:uncharacterized protein LOC135197730 n=1 Tax=Macrobrachium nipponense TaxID=159736 RepID=UPI0030C7E142